MSKFDPNAVNAAYRWAKARRPPYDGYALAALRHALNCEGAAQPTPPSLAIEVVERCIAIRHHIEKLLKGENK